MGFLFKLMGFLFKLMGFLFWGGCSWGKLVAQLGGVVGSLLGGCCSQKTRGCLLVCGGGWLNLPGGVSSDGVAPGVNSQKNYAI